MKNATLQFCIFFLLIFFQNTNFAQSDETLIHLNNPSFEDFPRASIAPRGWYDCGGIFFPEETPTDVHPHKNSIFGVNKKAKNGNTYLGMTVRENGSWESVSQRLERPLEANQCYGISIYLSKSAVYKSAIRDRDGIVNFTEPVLLRIYGGTSYCEKKQLLVESELIDHQEWKEYIFIIQPTIEITTITFEAFFKTPALKFPNGHILIDNASPIVLMDCDGDPKKIDFESIRPETETIKNPYPKRIITYEIPVEDKHIQNEYELENSKRLLKIGGNSVGFRRKGLSPTGRRSVEIISSVMKKLHDHKLIIDFNNLKIKKANPRMEFLKEALLKEGLSEDDFEIRNTKEEDDTVEWLVDRIDFFLGLQKKSKD